MRSETCTALRTLLGWLCSGLVVAAAAQQAEIPAARAAPDVLAHLSPLDRQQLEILIEEWPKPIVDVSGELPLDDDMRAHAQALSAEMRPALTEAARRWLADIAAADPEAPGQILFRQLLARLNHELVAWLVSSPGAERDDADWQLTQVPTYCRQRAVLHESRWAFLVDRLLFLQPLQGSARDAAMAHERGRWQAWLAGEVPASGGPTSAPQLRAFQAALRQREGAPVLPHAMTPWLSRQMMGEEAPAPYGGLLQTCALMQWWLANEVQAGRLTPSQAMQQFRHGTLPISEDLLLMPPQVRQAARAAGADDFPPIAAYFGVSGTVTAVIELDDAGRVRDVEIIARRLDAPEFVGRPLPLAFEQAFDRATFARIRSSRFDRPDPTTLRDGRMRIQQEYAWRLQ